jgi:hypothetical protein
MQVYQTDDVGFWTGEVITADESPMQEGVFLIPRGCVPAAPPALAGGERALWSWEPEGWTVIVAPVDPTPTQEEQMRWGASVIQRHLDATAQTRNYDSIHTAVGYRGDPNPVFDAEAQALFTWRSSVWTAGLAIMADVAAEVRPMPSEAQIISELPAMTWPD